MHRSQDGCQRNRLSSIESCRWYNNILTMVGWKWRWQEAGKGLKAFVGSRFQKSHCLSQLFKRLLLFKYFCKNLKRECLYLSLTWFIYQVPTPIPQALTNQIQSIFWIVKDFFFLIIINIIFLSTIYEFF